MSVVGTISAPAAEFRLGRALSVAGARIELERTVQRDAPLTAWVWTDDPEGYLAELESRDVEGVHCEERVDGGLRCSVASLGASDSPELFDAFGDVGLTLLSAEGDDRTWEFCVRTAANGDLTKLRRVAAERAIPVEVSRRPASDGAVCAALTAIQRETLVAAYHEGYYSTPRTATLADLAERFDVSPRAISQRLRRGVGNLVEATLPVE
ncbi:helix-turn-helix domain-containing protein [Halomarina rubra]|uniref:Helix-turn-helix domain-containing protein n=1 Tax=Halomarina rubra TaxID=2071873 RepID=A0ABD6B1J7_9EURY|nr:helix-turn-helix domain-containing protein [Halomarina rubra]